MAALGDHRPDDGVFLSHFEGAAYAADGCGHRCLLSRGGCWPCTFECLSSSPIGHPLTRMVSRPPGPPSMVEQEWMATAPTGTPNAPVLVFGPPLAVTRLSHLMQG